MDGRVLQAQAKHGRCRLFAVEDAFDLAIELEKVILAQVHFPVLNLHGFLDGLLQVDDYLVGSLRLNVLIDVAIGADGVQLHHVDSLRTIKKLNF